MFKNQGNPVPSASCRLAMIVVCKFVEQQLQQHNQSADHTAYINNFLALCDRACMMKCYIPITQVFCCKSFKIKRRVLVQLYRDIGRQSCRLVIHSSPLKTRKVRVRIQKDLHRFSGEMKQTLVFRTQRRQNAPISHANLHRRHVRMSVLTNSHELQ